MSVTVKPFGKYFGRDAKLYTLQNGNGVSASVTDAGGALVAVLAPDRDGNMADVLLGHDSAEGYETGGGYIGLLIGRHGNRIEKGRFELNGKTCQLAVNDGPNHLHGGNRGFDKYVWECGVKDDGDQPEIELRHVSPDGDEGFPGKLEVTVTYKLNAKNGVEIRYHAVSDADTVCNLTNHAYFNLAGGGSITGHTLQLMASNYCPCDADALADGRVLPVKGTPFDFLDAKPIGRDIDADCPQIKNGGGYDHNFCIDPHSAEAPVAIAIDPASGRTLEVYTDQPGVQFYSGNGLNVPSGKGGRPYGRREGFCLETQKYPNGMAHANYPSPVLRAGDVYSHYCEYRFTR